MDAHTLIDLLSEGTVQTLIMTLIGTLVSYLIGLPVGVSLIVTSPNGIKPVAWYNKIMGFIVNVIRSMPFLILMIAFMPYIRMVIGTGIGTWATTAALILAAWPFVARMVEQSLIGYSAMAGTLGGGGLGDIAIRYGHYRFQPTIMWITILVLVVIVQIMQEIGIKVAAKMDNRLN